MASSKHRGPTMSHYRARREFLRGLGVSLAAMPLIGGLESLAAAQTPPSASKKRFIAMYSPNGFVYQHWRPTGGETDFVLSPVLKPLERHRTRINILDRISYIAARAGGVGHQRGMAAILTGRELAGGNGTAIDAGLANGISVDQELAETLKFGELTRFKSLVIGVHVDTNLKNRYVNKRLSYRGPRDPLPPVGDPYVLFDTLFGSGATAPSAHSADDEKRRFLRKSVLDEVQSNLRRLQPRLSGDDRRLLESHADSIRSIELRLTSPDTSSVACQPTPFGTKIDVGNRANHDKVGRLLMDLTLQAFACDLTRIATFQWSYSETGITYPWLGINEADHPMQHLKSPKLATVGAWYGEQFAHLLDGMQKVPDGGRTLLENSVVLWTTCLGDAAAHTQKSVPMVMAGNQGGFFKTGKYIKYNDRNDQTSLLPGDKSNSDMLVSVLQSFGVETNTFGAPAACNGALPGIN